MPPSDVRITDPFILRQVESERRKRGDATGSKTACRLISERLAQLEITRHGRPEKQPETAAA